MEGDAEFFERPLRTGKNKGVVLGVRLDSGDLVSVALKPSVEVYEHALEWAGAALAATMKLAAPQGVAVRLSDPFVQALPHEQAPRFKKLPVMYGSVMATDAVQPTGELADEAKEDLWALLGFDLFIQNADRRLDNPNFLLRRNVVIPIDHGNEAFAFLFAFLAADKDPAAAPLDILQKHWCTHHLNRKVPQFGDFKERLTALSDQALDAVGSQTPSEWQVGHASNGLDKVREFLKSRRDSVESWIAQVEACLMK